jgi:photosystem II oxygen-evolving enhancer protein 2
MINLIAPRFLRKRQMLKRIAVILLLVFSLSLQVGISPASASGFKRYEDTSDSYRFFYPNGWVAVKVNSGADIVFHDIIEPSENISVVISPVPREKTLADLGTPGEVGYKLGKSAIAPPDSGRTAELVNAEAREVGAKNYYMLEYTVKLPNQERHNLASVAINRGKLYTFNASTTEKRWQKVRSLLKQVVNSFTVY